MCVQIYVNTLLNWKAIDVTLGEQVKTIMYMTNSSVEDHLAKLARDLGWFVFEAPKVSSSGLPFIKEMYRHASQQIPNCTFYGFSNGDILYNKNLLVTLDAVSKVDLSDKIKSVVWSFTTVTNKFAGVSKNKEY